MTSKAQFGDQRLRWSLGPPLGWVIAHVSGLLGDATWHQPIYWLGVLYSAGISLIVWKGNVVIWFWARGRPDWIVNARRRLVLIATAVLGFTVPTCLSLLTGWYWLTGQSPIDWPAVWRATLLSTLAAALIFNIYETIDLITQRTREHAARQQLEYSKALAELSALRAQIDPHFMFNSLNSLAGLIEASPERAMTFTVHLGDIYRYILRSRTRELVTLAEELEFLDKYLALMSLRFGQSIQLRRPAAIPAGSIPPVSLQLLLENALKHNDFSVEAPLRITVRYAGRADGPKAVTLVHTTSPAKVRFPSEGTGLKNLDERCRLVLQRGIEVHHEGGVFAVTIPLKQTNPGPPSSALVHGAEATE